MSWRFEKGYGSLNQGLLHCKKILYHLTNGKVPERERERESWFLEGFPSGSVVKNMPAKAGDARDVGLMPGSGRSHEGVNGIPLQYSAGEIPWAGEPGGL